MPHVPDHPATERINNAIREVAHRAGQRPGQPAFTTNTRQHRLGQRPGQPTATKWVAPVAPKVTHRGGQRPGQPTATAPVVTHRAGQRPGQPAATNIPNRGGRMDPGQRAAATQADTRRAQTQALVRSAQGAQMDPSQGGRYAHTPARAADAGNMMDIVAALENLDLSMFGGADTPAPAVVDTTPGAPGIPDFGTDTTPAGTTPPAPAAPAAPAPAAPAPAAPVDPYASAINLGGVDTPYRRPEDLEDQIRALMGERTTQDFSDDIRNLISERRTGLTDAEALRMGQIGDIETQLGTDIGALETDRLAQQQAMIDAIAGRASGLTGGIEDRLTAAREALGPQVTDEFEQVAQLVGGLGSSQAASSQDAMSRLAQVANMAAAERGAAPAQLAAEAELALGDEAFRMFQGLDQEQTQRLMDESMRQEAFNTRRDEDMVNALLGDVGRREDFLTRETERQQQMDYGRGERIEGQDWRTGEREAAQRYGTAEREAGQTWREGESALDRTLRQDESQLERDFREDAATMSYARSKQASKDAWDRSKEGATTAHDRQVLREDADRDWKDQTILNESERTTAAATAEAAGNEVAAQFYGLGPEGATLWGQMGPSERKAVRDRHLADLDLLGQGGFAQGSKERMVRRYGEDQAGMIGHAESLLKMYPDIRDDEKATAENQKRRDEFYAQLMEGDPISGHGALSRSQIETIKQYFAEMQTGQNSDRLRARQAELETEMKYWNAGQNVTPGAAQPNDFARYPAAPQAAGTITSGLPQLSHLEGTGKVAPISAAPNQPTGVSPLQATGTGPMAQAQQQAMNIINADPNSYVDVLGVTRDSKGRSAMDILIEQSG